MVTDRTDSIRLLFDCRIPPSLGPFNPVLSCACLAWIFIANLFLWGSRQEKKDLFCYILSTAWLMQLRIRSFRNFLIWYSQVARLDFYRMYSCLCTVYLSCMDFLGDSGGSLSDTLLVPCCNISGLLCCTVIDCTSLRTILPTLPPLLCPSPRTRTMAPTRRPFWVICDPSSRSTSSAPCAGTLDLPSRCEYDSYSCFLLRDILQHKSRARSLGSLRSSCRGAGSLCLFSNVLVMGLAVGGRGGGCWGSGLQWWRSVSSCVQSLLTLFIIWPSIDWTAPNPTAYPPDSPICPSVSPLPNAPGPCSL